MELLSKELRELSNFRKSNHLLIHDTNDFMYQQFFIVVTVAYFHGTLDR